MIRIDYLKGFVGELIGTFILVLFGCGSVAVTAPLTVYRQTSAVMNRISRLAAAVEVQPNKSAGLGEIEKSF